MSAAIRGNKVVNVPRNLAKVQLGYGDGGTWGNALWMCGLELQVNVINLFNTRYVVTVGSNGFVNSDPQRTFQTLHVFGSAFSGKYKAKGHGNHER
ncbi:hypothetical protein GS535_07035 [Saccharibacter sp. EH611]|uniref:hypothetical protein n=1 Tax=unclassified Saccharibacter TaxID=2648722 RepID=UPI001324699A|nr:MULTISPECIES: hypothetical protein [unclassified Saccharibacter]MXV36314.1 hypothetical protein [Saccharibacter sp. EH611]